jgi:hypothetical protein
VTSEPRFKNLNARSITDFSSQLEGWEASGFSADLNGAVWLLARRAGGKPGQLVLRNKGGHLQRLELPEEKPRAWSFAQPFQKGVLLVGSRGEQNALSVDWDGRERARWSAGDGIEDLRTTPDGTVWVSYFDEGVFGGGVGGPGLVAFTPGGEQRFAYDASAAGTDSISDAYALDVVGNDDVWLYFYNEFPIVRVHQGRYQVWRMKQPIAGAKGLAVRDGRALLLGSYDDHGSASVVELGARGIATVRERRDIVDESGRKFERSVARGVGDKLYLFAGAKAYLVTGW